MQQTATENILLQYKKAIDAKVDEISLDLKGNLYEPAHYILSLGGKRFRPALVLMACEQFGRPANEALNAALAVEVFHNFSLVHDDIMDKAPIRRGKPTVHTKWNENTAILSGDAMLVMAYDLLCKSGVDSLPQMLDTFNKTALEVCEGQQMDMDFEERNDVTIEEYIEMISLKTSVLVAAALKIGATIAKADKTQCDLMYDFGKNLGIAFQLQDDLMDVYADASLFGKQVGGDILSNKKTYLLLKAQSLAKGETANKLNALLHYSDAQAEEKVKGVKAIYSELSIAEVTQNAIDFYYNKSLKSLAQVALSDEKKLPFTHLAAMLMQRQS